MTENQMDGGSQEGTAANANGGASSQQSVQQPSFDATKLQESLDALTTGFKTLEKRVNGLQGVKDQTKEELSGLKSRIAEYEQLKARFGADGAVEQLELRDTLAQMNQTLEQLKGSTSTPAPGAGASGAVDAAKVVATDYGLDPKDPGNAILVNGHYPNMDALDLAVARHIKAQRQAPNPTQAQAPAPTGGQPPAKDVEALTTEYIQKMQAARGKPTEIRALREEYLKRGVKTWEVTF